MLATYLIDSIIRNSKKSVHMRTSPQKYNYKNIIVVSDLRLRTLLICLAIASKLHQIVFILGEESITCYEFGSASPSLYKAIKVALLSLFYPVLISPAATKQKCLTCSTENFRNGAISSLISWTYDWMASQSKYPNEFSNFLSLSISGSRIGSLINSLNPTSVFVFNGRLASTRSLVECIDRKDANVYYYEHGSVPHHYTLSLDPIHCFKSKKEKALAIYKTLQSSPLHAFNADQAAVFKHNKINNLFTRHYRHPADQCFYMTIFLSSPHELMETGHISKWISDLEFCDSILQSIPLTESIAIRAHPNMARDPSSDEYLHQISRIFHRHNVSIFGPNSNIDSHGLIKNSRTVAVNLSSIAIDAYFLGCTKIRFGYQFGDRIYFDFCESQNMPQSARIDLMAQLCTIELLVDQIPLGPREVVADYIFRSLDELLIKRRKSA